MIPTRLYADSMAISTLFYMFYMFLCVIKGKNIIFEKIFSGKNIVPVGYITSTGLDLCKWIKRQRQCKKGNVRPITYEQISLLDSIGMIWDPHAIAWEEGYSYAKMYYDEFHNFLVSQKCIYHGFKLGKWMLTL